MVVSPVHAAEDGSARLQSLIDCLSTVAESLLDQGKRDDALSVRKRVRGIQRQIQDQRGEAKTLSQVLRGHEAIEDAFRELAPNSDVLHLACHRELNSTYPMFVRGLGLLLIGDKE